MTRCKYDKCDIVLVCLLVIALSVGIILRVISNNIIIYHIEKESELIRTNYVNIPCHHYYSDYFVLPNNITYIKKQFNKESICSYDKNDFENTIVDQPIENRYIKELFNYNDNADRAYVLGTALVVVIPIYAAWFSCYFYAKNLE